MTIPLAPKHTGMRVSADGLLGRISNGARPNKGLRFMLGEMLKHLEHTAALYYSGKVEVVDEFFQLYDLDTNRPTGQPENSPTQEAAAAPKFEDLFPFEYVAGGYYRAVGYPVGQQAPMLRGMNAIRYLHAAMTGADPKPFLCSEKDGEL